MINSKIVLNGVHYYAEPYSVLLTQQTKGAFSALDSRYPLLYGNLSLTNISDNSDTFNLVDNIDTTISMLNLLTVELEPSSNFFTNSCFLFNKVYHNHEAQIYFDGFRLTELK